MAKISTVLYGELALLPYQPEVPVKETLEFLTDVITAYDASEKRSALRNKARQTFSYTTPIQAWRSAVTFNTEYGAIRKDWAIPIWTESQSVGNVSAGLNYITCNTTLYDLRNSSLAMLFNSCGVCQILEITTVDSDKINLSTNTTLINNAWLIPVRKGFVDGDIQKPTNGANSKTTINFVIDDNPILSPSDPTQYLSDDIYYDLPLLNGGSLDTSLTQQQDINDWSLGPIARRTNWNKPQFGKPYRSILEGASAIRDYKNFLFRRAGRYRSFWFPTFENNLRLTSTGAITNLISFQSDSFIDYASLRTHIAIEANGVWYPRALSGITQATPDTVQATLSSAININANTITRISYLGLHRFDADRIELTWLGNNVVEANVQILELSP